MDEIVLATWKTDMESELAEVEKQLSEIERRRVVLKTQLAAVTTLLTPTEQVPGVERYEEAYEVRDPVGEFIAGLKGKGWSVEHHRGRLKMFVAKRGGHSVDLWIHFSKLYETTGNYWFGLNPEHLEDKNGGVVLLLGTDQQHVCLPFIELREMLKGSTTTRTGKKEFHVKEKSGGVELQPGGTREWINVTRYSKGEGLERIGID